MIVKRERPAVKKSRLENEVILAVVSLYLLMSGAMLAIHHIQPTDRETQTSSTSPSHETRSGQPPAGAMQADAATLSQGETHALLTRQGYQEIRGLHWDGVRYRATAIRGGKILEVELDPATHHVVEHAESH